jgi:hypothetical protein
MSKKEKYLPKINSSDQMDTSKDEVDIDNLADKMCISMTNNISKFNVEILVNDKPLQEYPTVKGTGVLLKNNTPYKIKLINNENSRCDAIMKIDGNYIGTYRLHPNSSNIIERPSKFSRSFMFVKFNNTFNELNKNNNPIGLLEITFNPEKQVGFRSVKSSNIDEDNMDIETPSIINQNGLIDKSYQYGYTVFDKISSQKFKTVPLITEVDYSKVTDLKIEMYLDP